jgi:hypothetical protein
MHKVILLTLVCTLVACATTKPHQQYPTDLAAELPVDEYVGYSDAGEVTHTCEIHAGEELLCRDHTSPGKPQPPSGILIQDGIQVVGSQMQAPESESAIPIETRPGASTYDHQIRITRNALWFDDRELTMLKDGKVPGEAKKGGEDSLVITSLLEAGDAARKVAEKGGEEPPRIVLVVDQLVSYRTLTEVMYTLGQAHLPQTDKNRSELLATIRQRTQLNIACEQNLTSPDYQLTCYPVGSEGRHAPGVRQIELISVGTQPITLPKIGDFCDKQDIRNTIAAASNQIKFCYEKALMDKPDLSGKVMSHFMIGMDGKVTKSSITSSTMNSAAVDDCIARVIGRLEFQKPNGGLCMINYPFVFGTSDE